MYNHIKFSKIELNINFVTYTDSYNFENHIFSKYNINVFFITIKIISSLFP